MILKRLATALTLFSTSYLKLPTIALLKKTLKIILLSLTWPTLLLYKAVPRQRNTSPTDVNSTADGTSTKRPESTYLSPDYWPSRNTRFQRIVSYTKQRCTACCLYDHRRKKKRLIALSFRFSTVVRKKTQIVVACYIRVM